MAETPKKKPDIKDLDLAVGVDRIPEWWGRHGNKVLIGITVCALAYAFYTFRRNAAESARFTAESNLTSAREIITQLRSLRLGDMLTRSGEGYARFRKDAYSQGSAALNDVLSRSEDENFLVQALILRGDLNYTLSMLPDPAEAATRPTLSFEAPDKLNTAARESYNEILKSYSSHKREVTAAHLGLAAIAENAGDFDTAAKQYQAVVDDPAATLIFQESAKMRLKILPELARPMRMRASTQPTTAPATQP